MQSRRDFLTRLASISIITGACQGNGQTKDDLTGEEWKLDETGIKSTEGSYWMTESMRSQVDSAITKYRKGKMRIRLTDDKNTPLSGYKVNLQLQNHEFDWGFSGARTLCEQSEADKKVTEKVRRLFNCTTAKCYWDERWHQPIEHEEGKRITSRFRGEIDWGLANGMRVKGHPLVWTVRKAIPQWLDKYPYPRQMKIMEDHVRNLIRVGHGVSRWDLVNEMLWEPSLRHLPQRDWPHLESIDEILTYVEPAVNWARDENPLAIYTLNDYGLTKTTAPGVTSAQQRARYVQLVQEMHRRGCAPDAIGSQAHVAGWYTNREFTTMLNELAGAGLPLQITEFWARPDDNPFKDEMDEKEQQKVLNDHVAMIYSLAFAHPQVTHLSYWGSKEWFDENGEAKPLYQTIHQLIKEKWTTRETLTSNAEGEVILPAFFGEYGLEVSDRQGNKRYKPLHFSKNDPMKTLVF